MALTLCFFVATLHEYDPLKNLSLKKAKTKGKLKSKTQHIPSRFFEKMESNSYGSRKKSFWKKTLAM